MVCPECGTGHSSEECPQPGTTDSSIQHSLSEPEPTFDQTPEGAIAEDHEYAL
jgi:hypothetical protein